MLRHSINDSNGVKYILCWIRDSSIHWKGSIWQSFNTILSSGPSDIMYYLLTITVHEKINESKSPPIKRKVGLLQTVIIGRGDRYPHPFCGFNRSSHKKKIYKILTFISCFIKTRRLSFRSLYTWGLTFTDAKVGSSVSVPLKYFSTLGHSEDHHEFRGRVRSGQSRSEGKVVKPVHLVFYGFEQTQPMLLNTSFHKTHYITTK